MCLHRLICAFKTYYTFNNDQFQWTEYNPDFDTVFKKWLIYRFSFPWGTMESLVDIPSVFFLLFVFDFFFNVFSFSFSFLVRDETYGYTLTDEKLRQEMNYFLYIIKCVKWDKM